MKSCYFRGECSNVTTKMRVGFFRSVRATPFVFAFKRSQAAISISTPSFTIMPIACASIVRVKNGRSERTVLSNTWKWQRKRLRNSCFLHFFLYYPQRYLHFQGRKAAFDAAGAHAPLHGFASAESRRIRNRIADWREILGSSRSLSLFPLEPQSSLHSSLDQLRNASESYYDSTRNAFYWTRDKLDSIAGLQDRLRSSLSDVAALFRLTGRVLVAYYLTAVPGVRLAGRFHVVNRGSSLFVRGNHHGNGGRVDLAGFWG